MEFIAEVRGLVPDAELPLGELPCWFCSPLVSMAAEKTDELNINENAARSRKTPADENRNT